MARGLGNHGHQIAFIVADRGVPGREVKAGLTASPLFLPWL
jgi:hypothetical protein